MRHMQGRLHTEEQLGNNIRNDRGRRRCENNFWSDFFVGFLQSKRDTGEGALKAAARPAQAPQSNSSFLSSSAVSGRRSPTSCPVIAPS
jgi:hypothetical protein